MQFWSYLWGIETISISCILAMYSTFWSYLWGIETKRVFHWWWYYFFVLILPMRDWNISNLSSIPASLHSFDLTYEGLKRNFNGWSSITIFVLILPMRDWNKSINIRLDYRFLFWSYLWGIETPQRSIHSWVRLNVLILPMRDWNGNTGSIFKSSRTFWSYLWGIETHRTNKFL